MVNSDFYAEYLVEKRSGGSDSVKKILIALATILAAAFFFIFFMPPINLLPAGLVVYGGYYFLTGIGTEYEYIVSNGEMDVDKIVGKRKRKRLVTASLGDATSFGKLSDAPAEADGCTVVMASDGTGENDYYLDFKHKSVGEVRIIFTPSEKILDGMEIFLPRPLAMEFKRTRVRVYENTDE